MGFDWFNITLAAKLQQAKLEAGFLQEMDKLYSAIRACQHDYENNLKVLRVLISEAETNKALDYLDGMNSSVMDNKIMLRTGNLSLDAITSAKLVLAKSHSISINVQAVYPENDYIKDDDLCAIVGNLLDNAIEANLRITDDKIKKFIDFSITKKMKNLCLEVKNSYDNDIKHINGHLVSSKNDPNHGIGLKHVDTIISKYRGSIERTYDNGIFETDVLLPLVPLGRRNGKGRM